MDHYNERRLKLAESTSGSKEKLPEYDSKYKHAKVNYEALLVELKSDLGALDEDIVSFVCPIFANYVRYQNEFLQSISGSFSAIPGQVFLCIISSIVYCFIYSVGSIVCYGSFRLFPRLVNDSITSSLL